jgi:hypothetical protein
MGYCIMSDLDGFNLVGEGATPRIFSLNADAFLVDCSPMTYRTGKQSVTNTWHNNPESISLGGNDPEKYHAPMPFAGKVIGYWWRLNTFGGFTGTFTFHVKVNGVRVESDVLFVDGSVTSSGDIFSAPIAVSFNAGDRVEIERVRSSNSTHEQQGAFGVAIKWD